MATEYTREFVEYLIELTYQQGFDHGVQWADETMGATLRLVADPGPHVDPGAREAVHDRKAGDVVKTYLVWLENQTRKPMDPPPARLGYSGGPVEWQEAA